MQVSDVDYSQVKIIEVLIIYVSYYFLFLLVATELHSQ